MGGWMNEYIYLHTYIYFIIIIIVYVYIFLIFLEVTCWSEAATLVKSSDQGPRVQFPCRGVVGQRVLGIWGGGIEYVGKPPSVSIYLYICMMLYLHTTIHARICIYIIDV